MRESRNCCLTCADAVATGSRRVLSNDDSNTPREPPLNPHPMDVTCENGPTTAAGSSLHLLRLPFFTWQERESKSREWGGQQG